MIPVARPTTAPLSKSAPPVPRPGWQSPQPPSSPPPGSVRPFSPGSDKGRFSPASPGGFDKARPFSPASRRTRTDDARDYLREKDVPKMLDEAVTQLLKERPDKPAELLAAFFNGLCQAGGHLPLKTGMISSPALPPAATPACNSVQTASGVVSGAASPAQRTDVDPWICEYVWVSGQNTYSDIRSKYMTISNMPISDATPEKLKVWNFDGSSTAQAEGHASEIHIKPVAVYQHPFIENGRAVLADCYWPDGKPHESNSRCIAKKYFDMHKSDEPWFGLEQEYFMFEESTGQPMGWPEDGFPKPQGPYYCANSTQVHGREVALEHYLACLKMGLKISGVNAEVAPAQWEFQVGPCEGIEQGDHMVMARWVFAKIAERRGLVIRYDPKPIKGDWNGSGCHINFSTKQMRQAGGYDVMQRSMDCMSRTFLEDIKFYGGSNDQRMTGKHETSKLSEFTWSVGGRHTSVRIGNDVRKDGKGYMEDRRPASNIDPYLSTVRLYCSAMGYNGPTADEAHLKKEKWWDSVAAEAKRR